MNRRRVNTFGGVASPTEKPSKQKTPKKKNQSVQEKSKETPIIREKAKVLHGFEPVYDEELRLIKGEEITIISKKTNVDGWWEGSAHGIKGIFPCNKVELLVREKEYVKNKKTEKAKVTFEKKQNVQESSDSQSVEEKVVKRRSQGKNDRATKSLHRMSTFGMPAGVLNAHLGLSENEKHELLKSDVAAVLDEKMDETMKLRQDLRSLQTQLKAKQYDLNEINRFLDNDITSEILKKWWEEKSDIVAGISEL